MLIAKISGFAAIFWFLRLEIGKERRKYFWELHSWTSSTLENKKKDFETLMLLNSCEKWGTELGLPKTKVTSKCAACYYCQNSQKNRIGVSNVFTNKVWIEWRAVYVGCILYKQVNAMKETCTYATNGFRVITSKPCIIHGYSSWLSFLDQFLEKRRYSLLASCGFLYLYCSSRSARNWVYFGCLI